MSMSQANTTRAGCGTRAANDAQGGSLAHTVYAPTPASTSVAGSSSHRNGRPITSGTSRIRRYCRAVADERVIKPGHGRVVLVVVAHADDPTLFLGGTIARWADAGWRVVVVRATDDRYDSVGLDEATTIQRNTAEFAEAMAVLGVHQIVELGHRTDCLADASEVALREQIIRQIRTHRPYALVTFDPHSGVGEDNEDHKVVAAATDEAFWTSQFDLHHPEHLADGLRPHGCFERWYFGRPVHHVTDHVDISGVIERKVDAACCHRTMMTNFAHQLVLQADTGGWDLPIAAQVIDSGDVRTLLEPLLRARPTEDFRIVTFGGLEAALHAFGSRR
jgi:LmbE family N-acetylglucosaminyl deacetylase